MNCKKATRLMHELLDGDLGEQGQAELQAHLERCSACRNELRATRKVISHASEAFRVEPSREQIELGASSRSTC